MLGPKPLQINLAVAGAMSMPSQVNWLPLTCWWWVIAHLYAASLSLSSFSLLSSRQHSGICWKRPGVEGEIARLANVMVFTILLDGDLGVTAGTDTL